ncbi:TraM recognition domain-containing protein [Candidatus Nitrosotenuis chungbukensis]|uniref:type IV secretory system conjugative DNA transfer family protein n=1 Tax=Candidatus Nitrosotenuis chungbukensis TaxID=1353246 RepID=UPI0005B259DF|nr:TraM recognition domain-containing protein [Candidatus Nitrosotenuis chungbukensis]WKT57921.1 TraM recognition domain-containing protein [Candidatus Nitrosotenuis chungbukensis]
MEFGSLSNSLKENIVGIAPEDLSRHLYLLGGSGSGKSTLIRNLYKHLECANYTDTLHSSAIYIDIKDEDAMLFLRQCDKISFDNNNVTYLDINHIDFAVNLLELPKYHESQRNNVVSRMVGHLIEMFRDLYSQHQTYVQMERILRLLLHYLYSNTDSPMIIDLYYMIIKLQKYGPAELGQIRQIFKNVTGPEMEVALDSISSLPKDAWIPLLNRLEVFVTEQYLRKKFGVKKTTVDFEKILQPGNITIFRISDTETPKHVRGLAIMTIVIKIWFMIQERASKIESDKRSLVILTLDEFQKISDMSILLTILSQSRSYNLGLILSHQNIAQISPEILETVVGNTSTQIYGRMSGSDAGNISRIIDPRFSQEITDQITTQPDFIFTAKIRPPLGCQQNMPIQFHALPPPPLVLSEFETNQFIQKMKDQYGSKEIIESTFDSKTSKKIAWLSQLDAEFRTKDEWDVILFLRNRNGNLAQIVEGVKSIHRDKTSEVIRALSNDNVIVISKSKKFGPIFMHEYALSENARKCYFPETFESIGTAEDINEITHKVYDYYLEKKFFISLANQYIKEHEMRPDLIVHDYENDITISVEIESKSHAKAHPEQVRLNMTKWKDLGFDECHVWSKSKSIQKIKDKLGSEAENVTVFVIPHHNTKYSASG